MKDRINQFIADITWGDLILGAVLGLVLTSFATPIFNPHVTRFYEDVGLYSSPTVSVDIQDTGEYHRIGKSVQDFEGLNWSEEYSVYRVRLENTDKNPIEQLEFVWRAPGCIVYSNTDGRTAGGEFSLSNRGTYGIYSNASLAIDRYQCTKVIKMTDSDLSPGESIAVEFVVTSKFDKCDVLIDLNPINRHLLSYTWVKDGVRFQEKKVVHPSKLESTYKSAQQISFIGTRESLTLSSGEHVHSFVVGVKGDNLNSSVGKCVKSSET